MDLWSVKVISISCVSLGALMLGVSDFFLMRIMQQIDRKQTKFPVAVRRSRELRQSAFDRFHQMFPDSYSVGIVRGFQYAGMATLAVVPIIILLSHTFR